MKLAKRLIPYLAIVTCASVSLLGSGNAQQQFLETGRYVSGRSLCELSDEQLLKRFGDRIGSHAIEVNGRQIRFYESVCHVTSYIRSGDALIASASCEAEGMPVKRQLKFVRISPEAFRLGNQNYLLCRERKLRADQVSRKTNVVKFSAEFGNATRRNLSDLYNRDFIKNFDRNINWENPPFLVAEVRLKQKTVGNHDLIVLWRDGLFCGSAGCKLDVWLWDGDWYQHGLSVHATEVELLEKISHGVLDLLIDGNLFRWNGKVYVRPQ